MEKAILFWGSGMISGEALKNGVSSKINNKKMSEGDIYFSDGLIEAGVKVHNLSN